MLATVGHWSSLVSRTSLPSTQGRGLEALPSLGAPATPPEMNLDSHHLSPQKATPTLETTPQSELMILMNLVLQFSPDPAPLPPTLLATSTPLTPSLTPHQERQQISLAPDHLFNQLMPLALHHS